MCGGFRVAHIWKNVLSITAGGGVTWSWTLYVSAAPSKVHGGANSLDEAKAQVDQAWQNWLDTAGLTER